jgi:hypothetical protein
LLLVHEAIIAGGIGIDITVMIRIGVFRGEGRMREKPESAETVIDGDDDDAVLDERSGIVVIAFAGDESAAVDPTITGWRWKKSADLGVKTFRKRQSSVMEARPKGEGGCGQ